MENNFDESSGFLNDESISINDGLPKRSPYTVTTLYYSCDSNIFQSSQSSVQVVSANNYNAAIGHCKPNFCELDIIAKKEKLKVNVDFAPLTSIKEELKSLPMNTKAKGSKTNFRKKIYHKTTSDEPNEVLCLANVIKDDKTPFKPSPNRSREFDVPPEKDIPTAEKKTDDENVETNMIDEVCQTKKKSRSKSRRRKNVKEVPEHNEAVHTPSALPPTFPTKFADLGVAKTMYFVELPNTSAFSTPKQETAKTEHAHAEKEKRKHRGKSKTPKGQKDGNPQAKDTYQPEIIINKVEHDFPPLSSPGSATTVPSHAFKKQSELSFASIEVPKSTKTDYRKRNNSPNTEDNFLDDVLRKYKTDTAVYKGKHRRKHRTSPKLSSEEETSRKLMEDMVKEQETEVKVIYKVNTENTNYPDNRDKKKKHHSHAAKQENGSKSKKTPKQRSKTEVRSEKETTEKMAQLQVDDKERKLKPDRDSLDNNFEKINEKEDSVLNLYVTNKSLQSESCTMITDEDYLKTSVKKKRRSRKSKSRSPSPESRSKKSENNKGTQELPLDDIALLENAKERKSKQRSKSRVAEEKSKKTQHKSKAPSSGRTSKKLSRKSASDLLKEKNDVENFGGHGSIEGIQKNKKSKDNKRPISTSKQKKDKNALPVSNKTLETTTHPNEEVRAIQEKFPYKVQETPVLPVFKDKKRRSKSYAPKKEHIVYKEDESDKPPATSRSYIFDGSAQSSETQVPKRYPRSKKSKSLLLESRRDKFYEELKRISTIQQVDSSRKRFRVVSKTIRSAHISDGSTTQSTEQSYVNRKYTGSHRFKTYICSEKEKEQILNLPIFNKNIDKTVKDSNFEQRTVEVYRKRSTKMINQNFEISELEEGIVKEEKTKKKKKMKKPRREVSFSHLNVIPLMDIYKKPCRPPAVRRTLLPEKPLDRKFTGVKCQSHKPESSLQSEDTDFSLMKELARRFNTFTIILGEKILEISTKAIGIDGQIIEGFTVSGTEPPKRLRSRDTRRDKLKLMAKVGKLHNTFHPSIEIVDGVMQLNLQYDEVVEKLEKCHYFDDSSLVETQSKISSETVTDSKENLSNDDSIHNGTKNDDQMQVSNKEIVHIKTPVMLKTKRKFNFSIRRKSKQNLKKDVLGKLAAQSKNIQTSTESHSNSDIQEPKSKSAETIETVKSTEQSEKTTWLQKSIQKQEIKNTTRMSSAVKLMESSLQIIKEESQSTDSSSKRSDRKTAKDIRPSESEIKQTQTDFNVDDISKIKEVITYLYNSMDYKKPPMQESVATLTESVVEVQNLSDVKMTKQQDCSSTETSSYHEQFKNFVKNVTPKFCGLKKSFKHDKHEGVRKSKSPEKKKVASDICISSKIPTLSKRPSTCQVTAKNVKSESVIIDSLSSSDRSSSASDPKEVKNTKVKKNSKNFTRKRSSSVDVLTSGYFEKYKNTKELIEQQRKKRAESEDSSVRKKMPPIEPEFKSSTSVSDFSSVIVSFKDDPARNEKNDVVVKKSEEKYVQCVLVADIVKELIDKNIGTLTEDERDKTITKDKMCLVTKEKSSSAPKENIEVINEVKNTDSKNFVDKSLQTSIKDEAVNITANVLYTDIPCKSKSKKGIIDDLIRRVSSHSFITPRKSPTKLQHKQNQQKMEKEREDPNSYEKFCKYKRIFSSKEEKLFSNNASEKNKKSQSKKIPETDYINFIKLERHLEQVLGLYPSIFKAIRSHMDETTVKKLDKRLKTESPELFSSCDTLATTIDTVTEYKNTDSFEKYPSFSESNLNRFNRYCEGLNVSGQEYHLQQFINSQNLISHYLKRHNNENNKNYSHAPTANNEKKTKRVENRKEMNTTPYPYTDSSSTSLHTDKKRVSGKRSKKVFKSKGKTKNKHKVKCIDSATRIFSKGNFLGSSSDSSCCKENWSVASPLYSVTTPSANLSIMGRSQSSTSLMISKPTQTKVTKSRSVIEMSSVNKVNRKLTIKHLLQANHAMKRDQANQNVLVVSVNSSCTVFATPSKFLAKVEKQLKNSDKAQPLKDNEQGGNNYEQQECKKQVDEQSFHSLFFSDSNVNKSPTLSEQGSRKPFFIHKKHEVNEEEFPDSLEVQPQRTSVVGSEAVPVRDDEDLGNFSADSLETEGSKCKTNKIIGALPSKDKHVQIPPTQSFFVYTNTVNYDKDSSSTSAKDKQQDKNAKKQQSQNIPRVNFSMTSKSVNTAEITSNTLLSESGYESTKSKRTASIRNFFKKGGSLLDLFRNSSKNKIPKMENVESSNTNLTSFSNIWQKKHEQGLENSLKDEDGHNSRGCSPFRSGNAVYWTSIRRESSPKSERTTTFSEIAGPSTTAKSDKSSSTQKSKGTHMSYHNKSCSCSDPKSYQRQMDECHAYAEKVLLESQMRREGYYKQYQDFKEIPLELLIGKRVPNKCKGGQEVSVQTKPKSKPISTQMRKRMKGVAVDTIPVDTVTLDIGLKTKDAPAMPNDEPEKSLNLQSDIVVLRHVSPVIVRDDTHENKTTFMFPEDNNKGKVKTFPKRANFATQAGAHESSHTTTHSSISSKPSVKHRNIGNIFIRSSQSLHNFFASSFQSTMSTRDQGTMAHVSRKPLVKHTKTNTEDVPLVTKFRRWRSKSKSKSRSRSHSRDDPGCTCDGGPVLPLPPPIREPSPVEVPVLAPEHISSSSSSSSSTISSIPIIESDPSLFIKLILRDIVDDALTIVDKPPVQGISKQSVVQLPPASEIEKQERPAELKDGSDHEDIQEEPEICQRTSEDFRKGLTDKEVFDKILNSFEKEDEIAVRLSKDEEFFQDQIKAIKKDSDDTIDEDGEGLGSVDRNDIIYTDDPIGGKHRSTHFWEEKMKAMRAREENPVKEDDIGTCFSRGFRPDNIALSGDACFNLNKQDRLKFPKGMLTNEESIIDFSERETPLDYLLALGFMVDEASNALKDEDIRSRLLAAITEARVWINKITTTQGTLLYLVAYKSRPKTMRYFLQLVEAIINKRINNAIKLDGFLRVLEKVEEGEIQMINILGADKFEDEENEEKIVKKQLRQLFITVYKIAEKESMMKGRQLSQQAIVLLRILAAKYRAGLHPHLELIARYIGQELLITETQLEAAMIFLSRLDTAEVKLKEFEAYCDIKCEKKKKKTGPKSDGTESDKTSLSGHRSVTPPRKNAHEDAPAPNIINKISLLKTAKKAK